MKKENLASVSAELENKTKEVVQRKLSQLANGFSEWRYVSIANRVSVMRQLLAQLATSQKINSLFPKLDESIIKARYLLLSIENEFSKTINLPGPTGESNQLSFEPRGVVVSLLDHQSSIDTWLLSFISTLTSGNTMIGIIEETADEVNVKLNVKEDLATLFLRLLSRIGINEQVFNILPLSYLNAVLASESLSGSLVDIDSDWQNYLTQKIANRDGEILPVICESKMKTLYYRLVTEKTISIDTTAAGGNTSLMTMEEA